MEHKTGNKEIALLPIILVLILIVLVLLVVIILRIKELYIRRWATESISPERCLIMWYQYCIWLLYLLEEDTKEKASMAVDNRVTAWEARWRKHHKKVNRKMLHQTMMLRQKAIYNKKGIELAEKEKGIAFFRKEYEIFYQQLRGRDRLKVFFGIRPEFIEKVFRR